MAGLAEIRLRAQSRARIPKQVLAFYYGWYANPEISQHWFHWKDVDQAGHHIAESTHFPALGAYDSHDPKVIETHCREAKECGLTGFIASWWRQGDFHDRGLPPLLEAAHRHGLRVSVYYETAPQPASPKPEDVAADISYIVRTYGNHPAWLSVNGKPVIFVYSRAIAQLTLDGWRKVILGFAADHPPGAVFIGDQISPEAAQVFDGIHTYNPTAQTKGMTAAQIDAWARKTFREWVETAGPRIACVTIIPGFDDSVQPSRKPPRPITERHDGDTYRAMWREAIAASPDWILITSWNEWHEGSEIEPSLELGDRYLQITREFAPKFTRRSERR